MLRHSPPPTFVSFSSPPADVIEIPQSEDRFRLLYDTQGRFVLHKIGAEEAKFKLCRVQSEGTQARGVPYLTTHDGRTLRYPDPLIKKNDTVKVDLATGKVTDFIKFEVGNTVMVTKGRNAGRIGTLLNVEKHPGSFDIVHVRDDEKNTFATRASNVFTIGKGSDLANTLISIPRGKGIKRTIFEKRDARAGKA
jgi:small subunit ribosomal protein S4e